MLSLISNSGVGMGEDRLDRFREAAGFEGRFRFLEREASSDSSDAMKSSIVSINVRGEQGSKTSTCAYQYLRHLLLLPPLLRSHLHL